MAIIKCKMCGGDIELSPDKTFGTCEYCGSTMTFPKVDDEQRAVAFNRGNHFRRIGEFDKALAVYERIVQENDTDAEAHWCCALCRFGIEYVEDPASYEWLPTCHRASFDSFLEDVDYLAALDHSDGITRRQYQKDAAKIAEVQRGILATSQNEDPFDVFICYKESDDTGSRTVDSTLAQDVYYQLTEQGRRVFFARITLEDKVGTEYEPYIFAALNSAKVMIAVGTRPDHFNAAWVKNEWSRFLALMKKDRSKILIPCYRGMDPYDLPEQLSVLQSYDMGKIGFVQDLIRGIDKILDVDKSTSTSVKETIVMQCGIQSNLQALLKRGYMALEDMEWKKATSFFNKVLNLDAENAEAYWGLAMAEGRLRNPGIFMDQCPYQMFQTNRNLQRAIQYANPQLATLFQGAKQFALERTCRINRELAVRRDQLVSARGLIATGSYHTVGLNPDGTVIAAGRRDFGACDVLSWQDIIAVAAGGTHTVGLKSDGSVVATGGVHDKQSNVFSWRNIVAVAAGLSHTVGLKANGTVVAVGRNNHGECNVENWHNIIAIAAGISHTIGLMSDGTVVAAGSNEYGQCEVFGWHDIVAISENLGLRADGTVTLSGWHRDTLPETSYWRDIVAVGDHSGLKLDGSIVTLHQIPNTQNWRSIIAISSNTNHIVGVRSDGTVVAEGTNQYGECNVSGWRLFNNYEALRREREIARRHAIRALEFQYDKLGDELLTLKGILSGIRRTQIGMQLVEIEEKLNWLQYHQ